MDDRREIAEDGDEDEDETAAAASDSAESGVDGMDSMEEAQVFDSSSIQVLEEVTWVPSKMGLVGQWLQTLSEGSKEPLYTVPAPTGALLFVCARKMSAALCSCVREKIACTRVPVCVCLGIVCIK
jgi:hypothetical protein